MKTIDHAGIIAAIRSANKVLLCTHLAPDGDAIGSLLSLNALCKHLGAQTTMVCSDPVPAYLQFLPAQTEVRLPGDIAGQTFDLGISIDASDLDRLGESAPNFVSCTQTIQIDHHRTNTRFAQWNLVVDTLPASGNLAYQLIAGAGMPVNADLATCLYTAISTDTGNFCFGSLSADTFRQIADLMEAGLPIVQTARELHLMKEKAHVILLGCALRSLRFHNDGQISGMQLSKEDYAQSGAGSEHTDRIVNYGLYIAGVKYAYLASETEDGIKFSLRSLAPHDVSAVAIGFGGGGHTQAAGFTIQGTMDEAVGRVLQALTEALNK